MNNEYNSSNSANNPMGCSFNRLGTYTQGYSMGVANVGKPSSGSYVVPTWGAMGYDALTLGGAGSCSGYGTIMSAYGANSGQCQTSYTTSKCSGGNN